MRQTGEAGVCFFFRLLLCRRLLFFFSSVFSQCDVAAVTADDLAGSGRVFWNVPAEIFAPVALGQFSERAEAVEDVFVRGHLLSTRLGFESEVVEFGVDALLRGGLEAAGIQAGEDSSFFRREHVERESALLQTQTSAFHAAEGGGSLEFVVDLAAETSACFS